MATDFTPKDLEALLRYQNNWGRWGADDQLGALNLIGPDKRREAAGLVRQGVTVSLSREFPTFPGPENPYPAQHYVVREFFPGEGACIDYYGISYHGYSATHVDALCHVWEENGMWNGRSADEVIDSYGSRWGGVEKWSGGIITRGVLVDIPKFRQSPYVTVDEPVMDDDLERACQQQGITVSPGDALLVYSGRDAWDKDQGPWGIRADGVPRPGLHASVLRFLRSKDVAVLGWDMMDATPHDFKGRHTVHLALPAFGVALIDNCDLAPLATACRAAGRYEFMLAVAPLVVRGGTGSPVNPIAVL